MARWLTNAEIDQKVIRLVVDARQQFDVPIGCTGAEACKKIGLKLRSGNPSSDLDGMLSNGTVIVNQAVTWPPRVEFTIFHEIIHHLLDEDGELIEYFTDVLRGDPREYKNAIEKLCHKGAAEFLMPRSWVRGITAEQGLSASLVELLAEQSGASIVASAMQVAYCATVECYVIIGSVGAVTRFGQPYDGLHAEYVGMSSNVRYPLARFSPILDDHLIGAVWRDQSELSDRSYVPFPSGKKMPCYCNAKYLNGRVIGVLTFKDPTPREQLPLF